MRAVQVTDFNGLNGVVVGEAPKPNMGSQDVLIEVHCFGLSFSDVLMATGNYQATPPLPTTIGSDFSGIVTEIGPEVSRLKVGDRVAGFQMFCAGAQQVATHEDFVYPIPQSLSYDVAASLPVNYLTAHFALKKRGNLKRDETVLVHGAAGGVGDAAVRLAKAKGARVIAVVSTEAKAEYARDAGADEVFLVSQFPESVRLAAPRGIDLVLDPVGGDVFHESLRLLSAFGRLITVGFAGGTGIPEVKINRLLLRNIDVRGASWAPVAERDPAFAQAQWVEIATLIESGRLIPSPPSTYHVRDVVDGLSSIQNRQVIGKVVVEW